jgi:O-antigen ligase
VEPFYSTPVQLNGFGLNSIGQPDTRRMLGTMGNPNDNAILFLFFFVVLMPARDEKLKGHVLFLLAFLGCLFSQSRTGILALAAVYVAGAVLMRYNVKTIAAHVTVFVALYIPFASIDGWVQTDAVHGQYVETLASAEVVQTHSVQGRLEVWAYLWEMIKQKPLWGHAPYKDFFYSREIFPDGEYALMAWRYGLVGFVLYLGSVWMPAWLGWRLRNSTVGKRMVLFSMVMAITAVTNAPMNNPNMLMMFALITGLCLNAYNREHATRLSPPVLLETTPLRRRRVREAMEV